jgi:rRNA maturation endonuclease Nob1
MRTEKPYVVDEGVPSDVEEARVREAEQRVNEEMEVEDQYQEYLTEQLVRRSVEQIAEDEKLMSESDDDTIYLASNIGTGAEATSMIRAQRLALQLFPNAKVLRRKITQPRQGEY